MRRFGFITFASVLLARNAHACLTCDSQTAHVVRNGIFDGGFFQTLLFTVAPFPVFMLLAVLVYRCFPVDLKEAQ